MDPEHWQHVEALYHATLARPAGERAAFLAAACAGDERLRRDVQSLLNQPGSGHGALEGGALAMAAKAFVPGAPGGSLIGRRLGPYEVTARLGAGGMGEVFRARDTRLGRDVAIKILPQAFTADPDRLARFDREARVLASLNHPNIGSIYGVEEEDLAGPAETGHRVRGLVLELVDGNTLAERIGRGPVPVPEAMAIARQIADALEAAHDKGIVHRDLKPANIKISLDGVVKVLDFGLAKVTAGDGDGPDLTQSPPVTVAGTHEGVILGTAPYMSPEQARGKPVDKRTDIWAFGCVLYEMLAGRAAFAGETLSDTIAAILDREPDWTALPDKTPASVRSLLQWCLEKDSRRRLRDIGDARSDLAFALGGMSSQSDPAAAATITPGRRGLLQNARVAWGIAASGALLAVVLAIGATLYLRPAAPEPVVTRLDIVTPPTSDAFSFALSLDGRQLAFVANGEKGSQLWLRPLDQIRAQPLAGTEGATSPFWAPDGHALGFFADGKLKRIELTGGALQVLADVSTQRGGTWNADGVIVFAPSTNDPLMRVPATGGTASPVTGLPAGQGGHNHQHWPQFLPDGRRFLFLMATGQPETWGIYVASLDGGEPTLVMPAERQVAYAPPGYLLYVSQNVLVAQAFDAARTTLAGEPMPVTQAVGNDDTARQSAFSVSGQGILAHRAGTVSRRQLVWVDRAGKILGAIGSPDGNALSFPDLAPDGQRVAVLRITPGNPDVWLIEVGGGVVRRFTFDAAIDSAPLWSPDGSQVVFRTFRTGVYDLFVKPASGTADEQPLLVTPLAKSPLDWSRDGRFLLYSTQDPKTGTDLWALPMMGERKPFAVLQGSFDEIEGQFSPDGRWLAYASNESGRDEIYVRTFPEAGGKWQVSVAGGLQPRWRRDGHELFYVAPDSRLMAVPIRVAPDTHALDAGAPVALFPTRLATGAFIVTAGFQARAQYAVAADGRFLMNISADEGVTSPITIVQNWTVGLRK